ncbi:hypothetical protein [Pseudomonas putida]|uniref:hypothetical protein n=1 Tax=Pseudomonas putida TaxID=303 RepID=UPI00162874C7|nr:hypothetical protein [Pseudomonas putida]QNG10677.1 hypothetical protein GPM17_20585 [Pseudomonas putida]HDS1059378.1 hypothetical protein [Pseudomonas putida]
MEAELEKLSLLVDGINEDVISVRNCLADKPVNSQIREALNGVEKGLVQFSNALKGDDLDVTLRSAVAVAIYGQALGMRISEIDIADLDPVRSTLVEQSTSLRKLAEEGPLTLRPLDEGPQGLQGFISSNQDSRATMARHAKDIKKLLDENSTRLSDFEQNLKNLENIAVTEIQKITKAYEAAKADIDEKTNHINRVTGQAAARMIAGDYEGTAASEKEAADNLRYLALACMLLIVGVLGWAVIESTSTNFEWERFLSKISLVFLLGVPAAYLARESAKHREQQYHHLQTSLDMKAISPFLASLPEEEQHKLKALIATRIFGGRDFSKVGNDPYPINTQEIIMKIIEKADFSNKQANATENSNSR